MAVGDVINVIKSMIKETEVFICLLKPSKSLELEHFAVGGILSFNP